MSTALKVSVYVCLAAVLLTQALISAAVDADAPWNACTGARYSSCQTKPGNTRKAPDGVCTSAGLCRPWNNCEKANKGKQCDYKNKEYCRGSVCKKDEPIGGTCDTDGWICSELGSAGRCSGGVCGTWPRG
ncbi:hypothetical protein BV898_16335 [Hypsibius exemplaris]|uniref:Uncharacterized protein n=1 Tax=Hypsibius exemplaris TaxID=2072580 RepID=A0A9X6RL10_HYPEX|nr:hypothetical protein BV898_16335 [Hypsibius exemplaris]